MSVDLDLGSGDVQFAEQGGVARCTIDRPARYNTMTSSMYSAVSRILDHIDTDATVRALVISGTDRWFITGGDLDQVDTTEVVTPFERLRTCRVPVIAAVNGLCQASGLLIALLSDISIASDRARFRAPELHAGFPDTWLAAVLPAHVGLTRARDLVLTARWVDAAEALQIGLVARVVPHDELGATVDAAVEQILRAAPNATTAWKAAASAHYGIIDQETFDRGAETPEAIEGFDAIMSKRLPSWTLGAPNV